MIKMLGCPIIYIGPYELLGPPSSQTSLPVNRHVVLSTINSSERAVGGASQRHLKPELCAQAWHLGAMVGLGREQ